ncbi:phosphopantothenoylcysteine decarboxylase isoform X2 [Taeniopygia guttata]|uniref:phosphopantothenoylcysteine decarboxylase isoform X2 n=1 Tax=Taeniopygia guttata TaxID=59729 RepID=UPI003BB86D03
MVRKFGACYESYLSRSLSLWQSLVCCTETLCYGLTCTEVFPFAWQLEVKVVTTERAKHFYNAQEIPVTLYGDEEEWQLWKGRSDPVLHIELRRWADLMVVAPLDANTLGKVANGICDNLLTCVIRAWDLSKPLLFCPAMNTAMWEHPITAHQVEQLKGFGYTEIPCVVKKLVCGDEGRGAMAEVWTIVERVKRILEERDVPRQS